MLLRGRGKKHPKLFLTSVLYARPALKMGDALSRLFQEVGWLKCGEERASQRYKRHWFWG